MRKLIAICVLIGLDFVFKNSQLLFKVTLFGLLLFCEITLELAFDLAFFLFKFACVLTSDAIYFGLVVSVI